MKDSNYEDFLKNLQLDVKSKQKAREIVFDEKGSCYKYDRPDLKTVWIVTILTKTYSDVEDCYGNAYTEIGGVWSNQESADNGFRNMLREINLSRVTSLEADFEHYCIFYKIPGDREVEISMDHYLSIE